ncbi:hypothetical protein BVRB_7g177280 [Beta vulgaris subsp. vulgaris]|nr:hypothetical protein BVRB_7g177280 [Beta vulgaris subsp. vulgaris]
MPPRPSRANPSRRTSSSHLRNARDPPPPPAINPPPLDTLGIQFTCEAHLERFRILSGRRLRPTRFYDPNIATKLGIDGDLQQIFYSVGWHQFLNMHALSYKRITLEFLSTLEVVRSNTKNPRSITFQLMNETRHLNRTQLNTIFGWPTEGSHGPHSGRSERYDDNTFWNLITGQAVYYPQRAKASGVVSPGLRTAHRFLSLTIFARGDSAGVVTSRELYIVWCLVDGASFLNHAMWLMDHLDEVTRSRGDIAIGGMITIIASSFGLDLTGQQVIPCSTRLDLKAFQTMGWIGTEVTAEGYVWKVGQRPYAYLPNPERTVIYNPEN